LIQLNSLSESRNRKSKMAQAQLRGNRSTGATSNHVLTEDALRLWHKQ